jgi:hypothetical protein
MIYNQVPVVNIPEVMAFEQAKEDLARYKQCYAQIVQGLEACIERYNSTLEAADKAVRSLKASSGDFEYYQKATKIDAKSLHDAVGRETFLTIGGTLKTETVYKVDPNRLQLAVAQQKVSAELVSEVTKEEARYHTPKPAVLP